MNGKEGVPRGQEAINNTQVKSYPFYAMSTVPVTFLLPSISDQVRI